MELKLKKITAAELDSGARCILALKNKPFFFLWYQGEVLMNKGMKGTRKTIAALREMWQYDRMGDVADDEAMDRWYNTIVEASGHEAACQAWDAWHKCAEISRQQKGKAAAAKWYKEVYQQIDEKTWDTMYDHGYDNDFLMGLIDAYYDARKGNEQHFNWMGETHTRTTFAYGFLMGMEAAAAKTEQEATA